MKEFKLRIPQNKKDWKQLWKEHTSKRYRHNVDAMKRMTDFYVRNVLAGRWGEVSKGKATEWSDSDKRQFMMEMENKCYEYIHDLME